jgi:hypothetical protein
MSSGKPKQPQYQPVAPAELQPVPTTGALPNTFNPAAQMQQTPQTFVPEAAPAWMQGGTMDLGGQGFQGMEGMQQYANMIPNKAKDASGNTVMPNWYQMPSWGKDAVTGQALTQAQLQPPPPAPVAAPVAAAPSGISLSNRRSPSAWKAGYDQDVGYHNQYLSPELTPEAYDDYQRGMRARVEKNKRGYGGKPSWKDRNDGG